MCHKAIFINKIPVLFFVISTPLYFSCLFLFSFYFPSLLYFLTFFLNLSESLFPSIFIFDFLSLYCLLLSHYLFQLNIFHLPLWSFAIRQISSFFLFSLFFSNCLFSKLCLVWQKAISCLQHLVFLRGHPSKSNGSELFLFITPFWFVIYLRGHW